MAIAFAEEDPWYKTAPGCVIDGGNPQRTNVYHNVQSIDLTKPLMQRWKIQLNNSEHHIICGNNSIITAEGAFDANTGAKKWSSQIPINFLYPPYGVGQIYKDKQYVAAYSPDKGSMIYQVNPETGEIIHVDYLISLPSYHAKNILLYNDIAYLYDLAGTVVAYDINQQKVLWSYSSKNHRPVGGHIAINDHYLAFNSMDGLTVLDISNGKLIFNINTFFGEGPAFSAEKACAWGFNKIQCFDEKTGRQTLHVDEKILPETGVLFEDSLFFNNGGYFYSKDELYKIFKIFPGSLLKFNISDSYGSSSLFFAVDSTLYYYDMQKTKICSFNTQGNEKPFCIKNDSSISNLLSPIKNGLLAGYLQNNQLFLFLLSKGL
ncbi:MAG: PQQ-like domain [Gammaproteobacteria bacterium]|nr:PQQ-like domain [Gammaproteobacteria bacterium]